MKKNLKRIVILMFLISVFISALTENNFMLGDIEAYGNTFNGICNGKHGAVSIIRGENHEIEHVRITTPMNG